MSVFPNIEDIAITTGCAGKTREELKESADQELDLLKIVKERWPDFKAKAKEAGQEIKWSAEYIAAVIGADRTPSADIIRRANITRAQFVEMKRHQEKIKPNDINQNKITKDDGKSR